MSYTNSIFEALFLLVFIIPKKTEERRSNLHPLLSAQFKLEESYRYSAEYIGILPSLWHVLNLCLLKEP